MSVLVLSSSLPGDTTSLCHVKSSAAAKRRGQGQKEIQRGKAARTVNQQDRKRKKLTVNKRHETRNRESE